MDFRLVAMLSGPTNETPNLPAACTPVFRCRSTPAVEQVVI